MAVALVNAAAGDATGTSVSTPSALAVTAGNGLLVFTHAAYTAVPTIAVTDNASGGTNTYTLVDGPHDNADSAIVGAIYACASAKATENLTFTATASGGTPGAMRILVCQVSGQDRETLCDVSNTESYVAEDSPLGAEVTATRAGMVFGYFGNTSSFTFVGWDIDWTNLYVGTRSATARQSSVAGTTYTPGLTYSTTESGLILAANVQEAAAGGLTAYCQEIEGA